MKHTELCTKQDLANYLRCDIAFLEKAIEEEYFIFDTDKFDPEKFSLALSETNISVGRFNLRKKGFNGGYRTVHRIWTAQLNNSLKILNANLTKIFTPLENVHGFVKGKNIKSNAQCHLAKKNILSVDIKNYFETITEEMVKNGLMNLGYKNDIALWIAKITTANHYLVQGFCTSPTLANIVTDQLDKELNKLCGREITYTRYADDLYFSSDTENISLENITSIIENHSFVLNNNKTKFMKRGQKQYVTGLTTFDSDRARISKRRKKNIRLEINFITKFGYTAHAKRRLISQGENPLSTDFFSKIGDEITSTRYRLYGWLHFIQSIEPQFSKTYYKKLNAVEENAANMSKKAVENLLQILAERQKGLNPFNRTNHK